MKTITVGVIADILKHKMSGMGRYILNVIQELIKNENIRFIAILKEGDFSYKDLFNDVIEIPDRLRKGYLNKLYNYRFGIPKIINKYNIQIIHCPTQRVPPYFWFIDSKKIITIHGAAAFELPKDLHYQPPFRNKIIYSILKKRINRVLTVSESAKKNIHEHYNMPLQKIKAIYHGIDRAQFYQEIISQNRLRKMFGFEGEYLLHISNYQPKKNCINIIKAFNHYKKYNNSKVQLVIGGGIYWGYELVENEISKSPFKEQIVKLEHLPSDKLRLLYSNAKVFLFPSLHESFGLPILEAMACGVPVITSNRYSCPEVAEDAAFYVTPEKPEEIADTLKIVMNNAGKRQEMIQKGLERVKQFTWEKSAEEHLKIYNEVTISGSE